MKRPTLPRFGFICIVFLLFLSESGFGRATWFSNSPLTRFQNDIAWIPFVPEGEEFSAIIPAPPTVLDETDNYIYRKDGERVLQHRDYSGYGNGLVFIIESYKVRRPQRLMDALMESNARGEFEREITINGLAAHQHRTTQSRSHKRVFSFVAKEHVYFVTLATLEETSPAADQFLSSLRLRTPQDLITRIPAFQPADVKPVDIPGTKDLTRKALIVWKPEPGYTAKARADQLTGTVVLEADFEPTGYVTNIKVIKGMNDGMSEKAIDVARNIRFFPAVKDGKLVSLHMTLEYNFNLF
jgi:TonB family protein